MAKRKGYQGHESWRAWNVSLWIANDEGLYNLARSCLRTTKNKDSAASKLLGMLPGKTPDGAPFTFHTVRLALRGL